MTTRLPKDFNPLNTMVQTPFRYLFKFSRYRQETRTCGEATNLAGASQFFKNYKS